MFYISLSAKAIDPDNFAWLVFNRATKMRLTGYNQRHTLVLAKGDIFGIRKTRSNTHQLVKSDAMHVIYRNLPENTYNNIMKNSLPFKGPTPTEEGLEEGYERRRRKSTRDAETSHQPNRRVDEYYIPTKGRLTEKYQIDQSNYQWRAIKVPSIKVTTKKQGKAKATLRTGDIVGMRYRSPARGGYILIDGNVRVHISHELYSELVHGSRVLPNNRQKSEVIDLGTGLSEEEIKTKTKTNVRSARRARNTEVEINEEEEAIPKLYDLDNLSDEEILKTTTVKTKDRRNRNLRRTVRKLLETPEQDVWVDDDEADDFEDETDDTQDTDLDSADESDGFEDEADEFEDEDTDSDEDDSDDDTDSEDDDSDDDLDDEGDDDLDDDLGDAKYRDEKVADILEPGTMLKVTKGRGRTFVVVEAQPMERNENLMEYILHDPDADDDENDYSLYRLRLNVNMPMTKFQESAEILDEEFDEEQLKPIQDSVEYANIKSISFVK